MAFQPIYSCLADDRMRRMNDHKLYMQRAIELAANVPDFPFGALIVDRDNGKILAEGWNKSTINIPAHQKHRVAWTMPVEPTVWLAVFYGEVRE